MKPAYAPREADTAETGHGSSANPQSSRLRRRLFEGAGWVSVQLFADAALLVLGNVAALVGAPESVVGHEYLIWLLPLIVLPLLALWGLYRDTIQLRLTDGLPHAVAATSLAAISLIAAMALFDNQTSSALLVARAWLFGTIYLAGGRILLSWAQRRARSTRLIATPTIIVGAGQIGALVEKRLSSQPELGLLPIGYLDADPPSGEMVPDRRAPVLGTPDELGEIADRTGAQHVVLGFSNAPDRALLPLVRECELRGLRVSLVPRLFESVNVHFALDHLGGLPLFGLHSIDPRGWRFVVKHVIDGVAAVLLLLGLLPLMLALAAAVKAGSPGPVLFRQRRIGRDGREFMMIKFRSMREPSGVELASASIASDDSIAPGGIEGPDRRTRLGAWIRSLSLDELPQLFNVLRGEMSLVGPRPERPEFVDIFEAQVYRYGERTRVKSGITGWAQVHGLRGQTSLIDRIEWDNYYISNWSLALDFKILLMTPSALIRRADESPARPPAA